LFVAQEGHAEILPSRDGGDGLPGFVKTHAGRIRVAAKDDFPVRSAGGDGLGRHRDFDKISIHGWFEFHGASQSGEAPNENFAVLG